MQHAMSNGYGGGMVGGFGIWSMLAVFIAVFFVTVIIRRLLRK